MASLTNLVTSILLARHAGPDILGEFVVLMAWAHVSFALLSPGFDQAYIRDPDSPGRWSATVGLTLAQMAAILVLPWAALATARALWPAAAFGQSNIPFALLLLSIVLSVAGNLLLALLAARLEYKRINAVRVGAALGSSAISLGVAWGQTGSDLWPFLARELATGGLTLLAALLLTAKLWPSWTTPSAQSLHSLVVFARDLWSLNALEKLVLRAEYLLLALALPLSEVGAFYAVRALFDGVHGMLMVPVQTVLFAFMSRGHGVKSVLGLLQPSWRLGQAAAVAAAVALAMGFMAPLFPVLFGPRYQVPMALPIGFTALTFLLSYYELVKVTLMSQGLHRALISGRVLQLVVLAVAIPLLGALGGLSGAAYAPVLAAAVLCWIAWLVVQRRNVAS